MHHEGKSKLKNCRKQYTKIMHVVYVAHFTNEMNDIKMNAC